jgi:hypothetical protein
VAQSIVIHRLCKSKSVTGGQGKYEQHYNGTHCDDRTFEGTPEEMLNLLVTWWDESCGLKFINAVTTNHENPNAGYTSLIGQGDWCEDEDDEDEDY